MSVAGRFRASSPKAASARERGHPRAVEGPTLAVTVLLSALGALLGLVLITRLGSVPNSSA
ncbi:hypothetical protein AB0C93_31845 [Streptomyces sp. NPDC048518]|uniref:hypothetical protein n=1 Tax=Streptomyces sp. NPDC048518 TaxID=3155029 RepID=UPI0033F9C237